MSNQQLFNLYSLAVVGVFAQSLLAWELGSKGVQGVLRETNERRSPNRRILAAFGLFAVGGIWQRLSHLDSPYQAWTDGWPVLIAVACYFIARTSRPTRLKTFLRAKQLYEGYMRENVRTEPTAEDRLRARGDAGLATAESLYHDAIEASRQEGEIYDVAVASFQLGMLLDLQGRDDQAAKSYQTAVELAPRLRRDTNMIGTLSGCYYRLGLISKRKGEVNAARTFLEKSLACDDEINDSGGQQLCREALRGLP